MTRASKRPAGIFASALRFIPVTTSTTPWSRSSTGTMFDSALCELVARYNKQINTKRNNIMTRNHRLAFNALKKIGAPVYERSDIENFQISAEGIYGDYDSDTLWADYHDGYRIPDWNFGINPRIDEILSRYGLHAEWINAGEIGVYE